MFNVIINTFVIIVIIFFFLLTILLILGFPVSSGFLFYSFGFLKKLKLYLALLLVWVCMCV